MSVRYWLPWFFRAAFLVALSAVTWLATTTNPIVSELTIWDKGNHILAFIVLAGLLDYAFPNVASTFSADNLWKWAALMAYGLGIEVLQWYLGTRVLEIQDVFADSVGIAAYLAIRRQTRRIPVLNDITATR